MSQDLLVYCVCHLIREENDVRRWRVEMTELKPWYRDKISSSSTRWIIIADADEKISHGTTYIPNQSQSWHVHAVWMPSRRDVVPNFFAFQARKQDRNQIERSCFSAFAMSIIISYCQPILHSFSGGKKRLTFMHLSTRLFAVLLIDCLSYSPRYLIMFRWLIARQKNVTGVGMSMCSVKLLPARQKEKGPTKIRFFLSSSPSSAFPSHSMIQMKRASPAAFPPFLSSFFVVIHSLSSMSSD